MRLKDLARIILVCCILANTISLIFITEWAQKVLENWPQAIILGIFIFSIESLILALLLEPYYKAFSFRDLFSRKQLVTALIMGLTVWLFVHIWIYYSTGIPVHYPSSLSVTKYLTIFFLNSIPAALIEEFVFRFLPMHYVEKKAVSRHQLIGLTIIIAFIFSLSHVSAYIFRDHTDLSILAPPLISAFFYGMAYFFVYVATDNIYFTTLIHAFSNKPFYLIHSSNNSSFYFYTLIFVTLLWMIRKETKKVYR